MSALAASRIDDALVRKLVSAQFPEWAHLPVRRVEAASWDNVVFRLGDEWVVRLPSAAEYAGQVEKEHRWLPELAKWLPLEIPTPVAVGEPANGYPWKWSIHRWIEGAIASPERIGDLSDFAGTLARFLIALEAIESIGGPAPGPHNFHRGGSLRVYDAEVRRAAAILNDQIDGRAAIDIWDAALGARWQGRPVWIHGDVSSGNLLVNDGRLSAVIDFGLLAVGDPACDLTMAWTLFRGESRERFRAMLPFDAATWMRARGWTLWKAVIVAAGLVETNAAEGARYWQIIDEVLRKDAVAD